MPPEPTLVIACGALTKELRQIESQLGDVFEWVWLPAPLHNRPNKIAPAVEAMIAEHRRPDQKVLIGYGDCGTSGALDELCRSKGVSRLPGAHCYEFFAGSDEYSSLLEEELGTFVLTDFLAKHAEQLVFGGLGLRDHPELIEMYFGNYTRLVLVSQNPDNETREIAREIAERLGLRFEHRHRGLKPLVSAVTTGLKIDSPSVKPGKMEDFESTQLGAC